MSQSLDAQHEEITRCIRSLMSVLHKFTAKKYLAKQSQDPFLHYFTTLLTCGNVDREAKEVDTVTGSISSGQQMRALIVSKNPYLTSYVRGISLKIVQKGKRSLNEMRTCLSTRAWACRRGK
ncbi:hypothetical protein V8B97DRAFT_1610244 [Scleroderma yunnanense]